MVCCVTGHRPQGFPFPRNDGQLKYLMYMETLCHEIRSLIYEGYQEFITGMADGADLDFAHWVQYLRDVEEYDIKLEAALPYPVRPQIRGSDYANRRDDILQFCDSVSVISPYYHRFCMQKRNRYMVDKADMVLAIWNGKQAGGTWNTIQYACSQNKTIRYIMLNEIGENISQFAPHW